MLGLFVVLPVFALEAAKYPGGNDAGLVGLAMGIYGLTQGALQMVFGAASDKLGRKKVLVFGLLIFECAGTSALERQSSLHTPTGVDVLRVRCGAWRRVFAMVQVE